MAESNLDKFVQKLSPDELDQSIEIVKQLQKVLLNADGSESVGELSEIHSDVKQGESDIVLSSSRKSLSQGCTTASKTDSENVYQDALKDDFKEAFSDREAKIFRELISLMSSNSEDTTQSQSFSYKEVEDISRIKEEGIAINLNKSEFPEVSISADKYSINADVFSECMANPDYFGCGSGRDSVSNRSIEVTTIREYASQDEINIGQCPVRRAMENGGLNGAERETKIELSIEKQTMQTNSRRRRKNTNMFSGSKIQTKSCSKENTKVCIFCQNKFQRLFDLKKHVKTHTGQRPDTCEISEYKCIQSSQLTIHMRKHTRDKPYSCEMCEYKCTHKSHLNIHIRTHSGERPYKCEICDHKFIQIGDLKRHMRTHSRERPYKCEIYNYKFTRIGDLQRHIRTHSGERPYTCEICEFKCTQKFYLKIHMRTHSGERPCKCEICKYKFVEKGKLNRHMRIHSGERPYTCGKCEYKSSEKGNLKRHMKSHTRY